MSQEQVCVARESLLFLAIRQVITYIELTKAEMFWWQTSLQTTQADPDTIPKSLRDKLVSYAIQDYNTSVNGSPCQVIYSIFCDPEGL